MTNTKSKEDAVAKAKSARSAKFKLGPHNTMERFCATFIIFVVVLGVIFISAVHQKVENSKITLTEQAIYGTGETMFSLTQNVVKVNGLWTNEAHTKAFILIHVTGGMANLSTKAEDYQMLMTGVNKPIEGTPFGSIYVFGSTGYIGLGFADAGGFEPAAYKITLRNLSYLSEGNAEAAMAAHDGKDGSYAHHNELNIVANFAASSAQLAKFYEKTDYTATDIYNELVQSNLIKEKIADCDAVLASINDSMRKANEYARRLEDMGIAMESNLPAEIFGDSVSIEESMDSPRYFDQNFMLYPSSGKLNSMDGWFTCVDTNDTKTFPEGSRLYYTTDYVFPGGLNYNYQNLTADYDLMSDIIPAGMSYPQFAESLNEQQTIYTIDTNTGFGNYIDTKNGTTITRDQSSTDLVGQDARTNITSYESEISNAFSKKRDLQITKLRELLKIYYDSSSVNDMTSVYMNSDALVLY